MKKLSLILLLAITVFAACNKDKDKPSSASLKGKWNVENVIYKEYVDGSLEYSTTVPGDGTTMDFQDNGNVVIKTSDNTTQSFEYTMQSGSNVTIDGINYEVRDLTSSKVTLFSRTDYTAGTYDEEYLNLKR